MKKIGLLLVLLAVFSCQEKAPVNYALISGKIANNSFTELKIMNRDNSVNKSVKINENGSFSDTLNFEKGMYFLRAGKNSAKIYIDAGSDILIDVDANDFKNTLTFSGEGVTVSNYLLKKEEKSNEITGDRKDFYALEEAGFKQKAKEVQSEVTAILEASKDVPAAYKASELKNLNYEYLASINRYERYHTHFAKVEGFKVSEGFLDELEDIDYSNEEDFLFSSSYEELLSSHYRKLGAELASTNEITEDIGYLKAVNTNSSAVVKNSLLFNAAKYEITYTNDVEAYYIEFIAGSTNVKNNEEITKSYNTLKTVAKGNVSPSFENYENFDGTTTSLSDLKGKYVYVDVWATWCGPCKAEIPSLKKVEAQYHGKNIEFVSISVDALKDHDKWKEMVAEKELKGVQLFADKSWKSDFVEGYLIKGIPRFILIDTEGNIVNANAPRPSSEKLIELFNELKI
ncbi:TlpA family protein disulfide reductase [Lutibacter holmesii]|uniref:TlpA family protein disulfide reductase n=1 Tax=Lutibacter holmesii TaxID=1137985 RepID=A0ABW3WPX0_9FLAO